jgi:hypothetical protein
MVLAAGNMVEHDFIQSKGGYSAGALPLFENVLFFFLMFRPTQNLPQ